MRKSWNLIHTLRRLKVVGVDIGILGSLSKTFEANIAMAGFGVTLLPLQKGCREWGDDSQAYRRVRGMDNILELVGSTSVRC